MLKLKESVIKRVTLIAGLCLAVPALAQKVQGQFVDTAQTAEYRWLVNRTSIRYIDAHGVVTAGVKREFKGSGLVKLLNNDKDRYDMLMVDCPTGRAGVYESSWINSDNELSRTVMVKGGIADKSILEPAKEGTVIGGLARSICAEITANNQKPSQIAPQISPTQRFSSPLNATNGKWSALGNLSNPDQKVFVDEKTLTRLPDGQFTLEFAGIYDLVQNYSGSRVKATVSIYTFDCNKKRFANTYMEDFDSFGKFLNATTMQPNRLEWSEVEDGSLVAPLLRRHCAARPVSAAASDAPTESRARLLPPNISDTRIWTKVGNSPDGQNEFFIALESTKEDPDTFTTVNTVTKLGAPVNRQGKAVNFTSDLLSINCSVGKLVILEQDFYVGDSIVDTSIRSAKQFRNYEVPNQGSVAEKIVAAICQSRPNMNVATPTQSPPQSSSRIESNTPTIRRAHALVIGNNDYAGSARLANPVNDARDMATALRRLGFDVMEVVNGDRTRIVNALIEFSRRSKNAELALLFYAGHGVQINGVNYILPIDLPLNDVAQVPLRGISINSILDTYLDSGIKLVFLDACRDNPLNVAGTRGVPRGLAPMSVAEGTLISYSTKDGGVADDGGGSRNSPYTSALLQHLFDPDDLAIVLRKVRAKVMSSTNGRQQPWEYGSLVGGELVLSALKGRR